MSWTKEKIDRLTTLWGEGQSASMIARALGSDVTRNAVIGKVHRLGLAARVARVCVTPRHRRRASGVLIASRIKARQAARAERAGGPIKDNEALPPLPMPEIALAPDSKPQRFLAMDLVTGCHWVIGDTAGPDTLMCASPKAGEGPYCPYHRDVASASYRPKAPSETRPTSARKAFVPAVEALARFNDAEDAA